MEYYIKETDKKLADIKADIRIISIKLENLQKFKIEMATSAKWVSLIVSGVTGAFVILLSLVIGLVR